MLHPLLSLCADNLSIMDIVVKPVWGYVLYNNSFLWDQFRALSFRDDASRLAISNQSAKQTGSTVGPTLPARRRVSVYWVSVFKGRDIAELTETLFHQCSWDG